MCGIFAIFCKYEQKQKEEIISGYQSLSKRGPDYGKITFDSSDIFGFKRLSIVDPSPLGNQPFNDGNITLICNGEIYNHKQLEKDYDINCISGSDCECIIHLYKKIGFIETIKVLDGVFSIILVDGENAYIARDRIGVRPLFYGLTNQYNFAFASTASALVDFCQWVKPYRPKISRFDKKTNEFHDYEHLYPSCFTRNEDNIYNLIHDELINSVQKRLMSDRPMCCMLSGGLDSSIITSIVCKLIGPQNVRTYSIGMEGSQDLKYAKIVADYLGTNHTEVKFTPEEGFAVIPNVIKDLESYDITTIRASVGMWLLAKYISNNTDDIVVLTGEGSDELLMGYLYFHYAPSVEEANEESFRLVDNLYIYDVLRADRCISSHGLEPRVPFLDKNFVNICLTMNPHLKIPTNGIEKFQLRKAFENDYLPPDIVWRRKDGFSDGVSGQEKKWYEQIQDFIEPLISDVEFNNVRDVFPNKEAYYYKKTFENLFPSSFRPEYEYWLPKWVEHNGDPSGRNLQIFSKSKID